MISTKQEFQIRPFQERVLKHVMNGKSVILQAPTGSGKTRAALAPFMQNLAHGDTRLPRTCRYAVPMRVLANQFHREYDNLAKRIDATMPTRLEEEFIRLERAAISIQTGEQSDDPQFESLLTFCTIDQLLASFLAIPYGVDTIRANINVAAVASSYLVLDEFHLYPLTREGKSCYGARTTAIEMLHVLKRTTPFVLMTATFSTSLLNELSTLLGAEVESLDGQTRHEELLDIAQGRSRTFELSHQAMDADTILARHDGSSLVICNTVQRAQEIFKQLKERSQNSDRRIVLLHSRFTAEDRKTQAKALEDELGTQSWEGDSYHGQDIIVVATQVVEVGLDISVRTLHTEIAPANSLIQRAGRCARFAQQQGKVIVYPLPTNADGKPANFKPYDRETCTTTWNALEQFHERIVSFPEEQQLIDAVHTKDDEFMLAEYRQNKGLIKKKVFECLNTNNRSAASELIRNVSQAQILIHDKPDIAITEEPWRWQSFALYPGSLAGRWQALQEHAAELGLDWVCKEAQANKEDDPENVDNRQKITYRWEEVTNPHQFSAALMVVLPSKLATYDKELGFLLLDKPLNITENQYQSTKLDPVNKKPWGRSQQQSYQDHIEGLVRAYNHNIKKEIGYITHKLEKELKLPTGKIDQAIRLAIACHDLGKLDRTWQQWARESQALLSPHNPPEHDFFFAKTDNDYSREQRERQKKVLTKRPHHACESVMLGRRLIATSLGLTSPADTELHLLLRAVCGAIARHHTPSAHQHRTAHLDENARKAAEDALELARQNESWGYDLSLLDLTISKDGDLAPEGAAISKITRPEIGPVSELETWLYFVIVRALRLSDQRAGIIE